MKKGWIIAAAAVLLLSAGGTKKDSENGTTPATEAPTRTVVIVTNTPRPTAKPTPEPTEAPEPTPTPRVEHTYVLNINSGVVHIKGCRHEKRMKDSNKREIVCTREELIAMGYNLCDVCNP